MLWLLVVHAVVVLAVPAVAARLGRRVMLLGALAPAVAFVWLLGATPEVLAGATPEASITWAPVLGLALPLRLDGLALVLALVISGVGTLVLGYATRYFAGRSEGLGVTAAALVAFAGAMLGLVLTDHLLGLYVFWELTTVCSFVLIGDRGTERANRRAAVQALLVTTGGGFVLLLGLLLLGETAGTWRLSGIVAAPPSGAAATTAMTLILVGAFAKSALIPFHPWLPSAMVAPTPVSAYLHAAAMVKAGVYLVARLAPAFAETLPWRQLTVTVGLASMLVGGWRALAQTDLKRLLAFATVSQLGFLVVLLGAGTHVAALAGIAMLLAHALFKATLFLVVGIIDHQAGTRDLRELSGVRRRAPALTAVAVLACASMAGLPPFVGYLGKEAALEAFAEPFPAGALVLTGITAGSALTVAYTLRFLWGAFADRPDVTPRMHRPPASFTAPAAVLALAGLALGLLPHRTHVLASGYADAFPIAHAPYELKLWHGLTPTLALTALSLAAGAALHALRGPAARLRARLPAPPELQRGYELLARGVRRTAAAVTAHIQTGRLPQYLAVVLLTVVAVPGTALVTGTGLPGSLRAWDSPMQALLGGALLVACAGVVVARGRLAAVLTASAVGYLVAALFVAHGAPDLALTQLLVESITLMVLVFVVRRAPREFRVSRPGVRLARTVVALAVGAFMTGVSVAVTARRAPSRVAEDYIERAPEAGGHNAVSAILLNFRALDTLGEITVVAVAATGVASLILVHRRTGGPGDTHDQPDTHRQPAAAGTVAAGTSSARSSSRERGAGEGTS